MRASTGEYPKNWPEITRRCKERAGWKCERCGRPHEKGKGRGLNAHHLDWNRSNCADWNLVCLCAKCHLWVQREVERLTTWLMSKEAWLQPHIDGYCQWVSENIQKKIVCSRTSANASIVEV